MRVGFPGGPRLEWYDRNPIVRVQNYNPTAVAPHAQQQRWSYTVPTGKKAFIELMQVQAYRATAATTVGMAQAGIFYYPNGGTNQPLLLEYIRTNNVGDRAADAIGNSGVLLASDQLTAYTQDNSTGGTVDYNLNAKIMEFDA